MGVNFANKGAELMLRAVLDEVGRWPGTHIVGLPLTSGSVAERRSVGARSLLVRPSDRRDPRRAVLLALANRVPRSLAEGRGWMRLRDVDLVLDASGFAFSDQWGAARARRSERLYRSFAARGRPVILLPQALGPFRTPAVAEAFRGIAASAALIFARDDESLAYARGAAPAATDLRLSPDFTAGFRPPMPHPARQTYTGRAAVIPNARMLDRTSAADREWYLGAIAQAFERLQARGADPYVLLVQEEDRSVVDLSAGPVGRAEVVSERDPAMLKDLIGVASLVVGSRYHGLVSAMSQGIPSLGFGWSHKYRALFEDYGCPELLIESPAPLDAVTGTLDRLLDPSTHAALAGSLRRRAEDVQAANRRMWMQVREVAGVV